MPSKKGICAHLLGENTEAPGEVKWCVRAGIYPQHWLTAEALLFPTCQVSNFNVKSSQRWLGTNFRRKSRGSFLGILCVQCLGPEGR